MKTYLLFANTLWTMKSAYILNTFVLILFLSSFSLLAQSDSTHATRFPYTQLIIPATLMTYGIIAQESPFLQKQNQELNDELHENIDRKFTIDDFSQWAPSVAVYALSYMGIPSKHQLREQLFVSALSHFIMGTSVYSMKHSTPVWRPDHTNQQSFPSGHTATAFVGAEMLWQEYKEQSIWYGIAGYGIATGTGFFRMYNNKHWFSDVAMGAGIGILSTKIAYWILPLVDHHIQKAKSGHLTMASPFYNGKQMGILANLTM